MSRQNNKIMIKQLLLSLSGFALAPSLALASCVPSVANDDVVPYYVTTVNSAVPWVSYSTGYLSSTITKSTVITKGVATRVTTQTLSLFKPTLSDEPDPLAANNAIESNLLPEIGGQVFNDRYVPVSCPKGSLICPTPTQPFNINKADILGVKIVTASNTSTIDITFTLESDKNALISFTGTCDAMTNMLYGSASWAPNKNNTMSIFNFGTPVGVYNATPK